MDNHVIVQMPCTNRRIICAMDNCENLSKKSAVYQDH